MPAGSIDPGADYVEALGAESKRDWPQIATASAHANEVLKLLTERMHPFTSGDVDLVVFGSLARREWTSGSDVDWTMLVDGLAKCEHRGMAREIENTLADLAHNGVPLKEPGTQGIFGNMAFSHDIVHHIGGQADTNRNTTQRILLLLEATPLRAVADRDGSAFDRTVRQVLNRYLVSDSNFHKKAGDESRIPRFLLNDIVRYWRTMCVDFAYKDWEQAGKKWGLRNVKLRMSRKLLFISGLFTVFSCFKNPHLKRDPGASDDDYVRRLQRHLLAFVHSTPLNIATWTLRHLGFAAECIELIDIYQAFLASIDNHVTRDRLTSLSQAHVYDDDIFLQCRENSHRLNRLFRRICFEIESPLRDFMIEYGVF
jgi:predicted nucleotidyltransferase